MKDKDILFKETRNLRDIVKPFIVTKADEHGLYVFSAPHSEYIHVDNMLFTLGDEAMEIENPALAKRLCNNRCEGATGYIVMLKPHIAFPDKFNFAYQCDNCNKIYIANYPLKDLRENINK